MEEEILNNIGVVGGTSYISYPSAGAWRVDTLLFQENKITNQILKRPITSAFPIFARFCDDHLTGETICDLSDGTPAITIEDQTLKFIFDPFAMYIASLDDGFRSSRMDMLKQSALMMYWNLPPTARNVSYDDMMLKTKLHFSKSHLVKEQPFKTNKITLYATAA